jgi:hypothetical protein
LKKALNSSLEPSELCRVLDLATPDCQYAVSKAPQFPMLQAIALDVAIELCLPKSRVALWNGGGLASRVSMPKTAMHEDRQLDPIIVEIWAARKVRPVRSKLISTAS